MVIESNIRFEFGGGDCRGEICFMYSDYIIIGC